MAIERKIPEHQHFSSATVLIGAVLVAMIAIFAALLYIASGLLVSGLILASGAVIVGLMTRRVVGARAMWLCFGLAALAILVGVLLQLMTAMIS